jgi:MFS family permease
VSVASVFIISVSLYLFSQSREVVWLAVFGALWIGAQTAFTTATGAWSKDLYPSDKRGQFSGYMTMFTVAFTMVPGPLIGGLIAHTWGVRRVIEGREAVIPTGAIFGASAILVLLTLIPLYAVTERKPNAGEA